MKAVIRLLQTFLGREKNPADATFISGSAMPGLCYSCSEASHKYKTYNIVPFCSEQLYIDKKPPNKSISKIEYKRSIADFSLPSQTLMRKNC